MAAAIRPARLIAALGLAVLVAYLVVWAQVSPLNIGRSDFTSTYVGATLLRDGQRERIYDEPSQQELHTALIAPDTEGNLPFVDAPISAALAAPVTLLDLRTAYRIWSVLQLAILVLAVVIAVRHAPWPSRVPRSWKIAAALAALAGAGSLVALMQAQWGSVTALGLALAYRDWRHGRHARGAAVLIIAAGIAKPHLAAGLIAFMVGWRQRRVIAGALCGAALVAGASIAVVGVSGLGQFLGLALTSNTRWQLRTFSGFVGIPGSFLGNSATAQVIGAAGSIVALAAAGYLGALVRRRPARLDPALAGAAVLSLLAAPHAGIHDLVMIAPAMAWSAALVAQPDLHAAVSGVTPRMSRGAGLGAAWTLLSLAAFVGLGDGVATPPGQLVPWVLIGGAVMAWRAALRSPASPDHRLTSAVDEATLGSVAHGVHRRGGFAAARVLPLRRGG